MNASKDWLFVRQWMKRADVRPVVYDVIRDAYAAGYDAASDGITLMPELEFSGVKLKHPVGVGHDWLYHRGEWPRSWCDDWFRIALIDFGHSFRAPLWWAGLRLGGWKAWREHRLK